VIVFWEPMTAAITVQETQIHQIGDALMLPDGVIVLRIRFPEGEGYGEEELRYAPGTAEYARVRAHLPGLAIGHSVPLYNDWPE